MNCGLGTVSSVCSSDGRTPMRTCWPVTLIEAVSDATGCVSLVLMNPKATQIHVDLVSPPLLALGLGHAHERRLGRRVVDLARVAAQPGNGGNVDHLPKHFAPRMRLVLGETADQVVDFLNGLRPNNKAYVRVWRQDPSYQVNGQDLPDLPSSAALIFARQQTNSGTVPLSRGSNIAEIPLDAGDGVVTGSKTVQVEIRE